MAKPLRETPPSSAVVRLFDAGSAARAIGRPEELRPSTPLVSNAQLSPEHPSIPASPHAVMRSTGEPANIKRELVLSPSTDETFTRIVDLCKRATGARLTNSHVARAIFKSLEQCLPAVEREVTQIGHLKLPSNARGREGDRERFEDKLAEAITNGIRKSAAYRSED